MSPNKTSLTAYTVVSSIAKLAKMPEWAKYMPEEMAQLSKGFAGKARDSYVKFLISWIPVKLAMRLMDTLFIPGMTHHYLFRKLLIQSQTELALEQGARQVIILGGGLDTLSLRMAKKWRQAAFFEVDLPNTQGPKLGIFKKIGSVIPENCHFIEADLTKTNLETALQPYGFDAKLPTLVIIEGVLMYLSNSEVKALFNSLHDSIKGDLSILFGAMAASDEQGGLLLRLTNFVVGKGGEPTKWYCKSKVMPEFMANLGFELKSWMPYKKLQTLFRPLKEIETIPEEDENYYFVVKTAQKPDNLPLDQISFIPIKI